MRTLRLLSAAGQHTTTRIRPTWRQRDALSTRLGEMFSWTKVIGVSWFEHLEEGERTSPQQAMQATCSMRPSCGEAERCHRWCPFLRSFGPSPAKPAVEASRIHDVRDLRGFLLLDMYEHAHKLLGAAERLIILCSLHPIFILRTWYGIMDIL